MQSVIVKDFIKENELKDCLIAFFKGSSISYFNLVKGDQSEDVLFEYILLQGDFKFELCLYTDIVFSIEDLSVFICKHFTTEVLISDNSINPYSWILIANTGRVGKVKQVVREDDFFLIEKPKM